MDDFVSLLPSLRCRDRPENSCKGIEMKSKKQVMQEATRVNAIKVVDAYIELNRFILEFDGPLVVIYDTVMNKLWKGGPVFEQGVTQHATTEITLDQARILVLQLKKAINSAEQFKKGL
jgi:hypothetical protein